MSRASTVAFVLSVIIGNLACLFLLFELVHWILGALSGWHRLARTYGCSPPGDVWTVSRDSGRVGFIRYYRCVRAGVRAEGLYLAVTGLLRHKPLLIPWRDVRSPRQIAIYGRPCYAFDAGDPGNCEIVVSGALYRMMYPYLGGCRSGLDSR